MNQVALKRPAATGLIESRRSQLLAAAPRLAELLKLEQLTPVIVAEAASLPESDFKAEFDTVSDYLAEVQNKFLENILARLVKEVGHLRPSLERTYRAATTQLDLCLEQRALRALLAEARRRVPRVAEDLHRRNQGTSLMISIELKAIGCKNPMVIARYFCMMVLEAAQIEADAGVKVPEARQALRDFLGMWVPVRPVA